MKAIKINNRKRIILYDRLKIRLKKMAQRMKSTEIRDEGLLDILNVHIISNIIKLKKNECYIQVDGLPTFWLCQKTFYHEYIVHKNVTEINTMGDILTVHYEGEIQKYRYDKNYGFFEKTPSGEDGAQIV